MKPLALSGQHIGQDGTDSAAVTGKPGNLCGSPRYWILHAHASNMGRPGLHLVILPLGTVASEAAGAIGATPPLAPAHRPLAGNSHVASTRCQGHLCNVREKTAMGWHEPHLPQLGVCFCM